MSVTIENIPVDANSRSPLPRSSATHEEHPQASSADPSSPKPDEKASPTTTVPEVNVNGEPIHSPRPSTGSNGTDDETVWGSNFWVTLVDPQVRI
ncbi:hypothetical protein SERLA73DRAFT_179705 [Serpula lacrymans var. lacrymans S7.3]|uniref:Uncharacterized protein n=2 Tax=Serpula lacrymans var. lacrymans TaxID=341189 RepID=F8PTY8_SERL3|nr:uncharacterized protein SERLADRAFT_464937 [Serpula lacrymans var. lacrymans S7.9]EGN99613.1 hypothetical protein SERLA73DRAFT_179705 [Serpula lacrymans var. lacrymans S7.3]EGO25179.1 hypothetical protein SERLADRAFT_464937 [Serpula lacrymans var. lacrymans S7.9]